MDIFLIWSLVQLLLANSSIWHQYSGVAPKNWYEKAGIAVTNTAMINKININI